LDVVLARGRMIRGCYCVRRCKDMKKYWLALAAPFLLVAVPVGLSSVVGDEPLRDISELILSNREPDRLEASRMVLARRQHEIEALRAIIRRPIDEREEFYASNTPRNVAIRILGSMRANEAVPDLIALLVPKEGQPLIIGEPVLLAPAGEALVDIGLPAVSPLIETLTADGVKAGGHYDLGGQCLKTLVFMLGPENTGYFLKKARDSDTDPAKKRNLDAALTVLEKPGFLEPGLLMQHRHMYDLP
jgi:hypothetical protein